MPVRALVLLLLALVCAVPAPSLRTKCKGTGGLLVAAASAQDDRGSCCGTECRCTPASCACTLPEQPEPPAGPSLPPSPREPFSLPMPLVACSGRPTLPPAPEHGDEPSPRPRAPPVALHVRHCVWRT